MEVNPNDPSDKTFRPGRKVVLPPHLSSMLRMEEVMVKLGMSRSTIEIGVKEGRYHPIRVRGVLLFNPAEVDAEIERRRNVNRLRIAPDALEASQRLEASKMKRLTPPPQTHTPAPPSSRAEQPALLISYTGEQCSEAIRLFSEGKTPRDVIRELKVTFEVGEHFWKKYRALGDEILLDQENLARIRSRLDWFESPPTARGLVAAIDRFVLKNKEGKETKEAPLTEEEKKALAELNSSDPQIPSEE